MATWSTCAASRPATTISWTACATPASTTATPSITKSVEVYKGPASTLFGRGSTGGVINQVLKAPQLYPIDDFVVTGGTNGEIRGTADVNYRARATQRHPHQRDGPAQQPGGPSLRAQPALGHRAVDRLRSRHRHDLHAEIPAPAGRQHPRLRHSVRVRKAGAGARATRSTACRPTTASRPRSMS